MYKLGLCSVTFKQLSVEKVVELAAKANLDGIEWGSDVHVPVGDVKQARRVKELTLQAGLEVASYGSYYHVGDYDKNDNTFEKVLATAVQLGAPSIRIWAGSMSSKKANPIYRETVVEETHRIANLAKRQDIQLNLEYHECTLTDEPKSARLLMQEISHPNVKVYWQPAVGLSVSERLASIDLIYPWLTDVHVFHWEQTNRLSLEMGKSEWRQYLDRLEEKNMTRYLYLEFVKGGSTEQFLRDAKALKSFVRKTEEFN